jgi:hypothetical protein
MSKGPIELGLRSCGLQDEHGKWWPGPIEIDLVLLEKKDGRYVRGNFFEVK